MIAIMSCTYDPLTSTNYILIIIEGGRLQTHGNHEILFLIEFFFTQTMQYTTAFITTTFCGWRIGTNTLC